MTRAATNFAFVHLLVIQENKKAVKKAVKEMYKDNMQIKKEARLLPFYIVDLSLL